MWSNINLFDRFGITFKMINIYIYNKLNVIMLLAKTCHSINYNKRIFYSNIFKSKLDFE